MQLRSSFLNGNRKLVVGKLHAEVISWCHFFTNDGNSCDMKRSVAPVTVKGQNGIVHYSVDMAFAMSTA